MRIFLIAHFALLVFISHSKRFTLHRYETASVNLFCCESSHSLLFLFMRNVMNHAPTAHALPFLNAKKNNVENINQ